MYQCTSRELSTMYQCTSRRHTLAVASHDASSSSRIVGVTDSTPCLSHQLRSRTTFALRSRGVPACSARFQSAQMLYLPSGVAGGAAYSSVSWCQIKRVSVAPSCVTVCPAASAAIVPSAETRRPSDVSYLPHVRHAVDSLTYALRLAHIIMIIQRQPLTSKTFCQASSVESLAARKCESVHCHLQPSSRLQNATVQDEKTRHPQETQ